MEDPQGLLEGAGQNPATYVGFVPAALIPGRGAWHLGVLGDRGSGPFLN